MRCSFIVMQFNKVFWTPQWLSLRKISCASFWPNIAFLVSWRNIGRVVCTNVQRFSPSSNYTKDGFRSSVKSPWLIVSIVGKLMLVEKWLQTWCSSVLTLVFSDLPWYCTSRVLLSTSRQFRYIFLYTSVLSISWLITSRSGMLALLVTFVRNG